MLNAEGSLPSLGYAVQVSASFAELCLIIPPKHFLVPFLLDIYYEYVPSLCMASAEDNSVIEGGLNRDLKVSAQDASEHILLDGMCGTKTTVLSQTAFGCSFARSL